MGRFSELAENSLYVLREEGIYAYKDRLNLHVHQFLGRFRNEEGADPLDICTDVLFINGCAYSVPHPIRYRVDHQVEQLNAHGISCRKIDEWNLVNDFVRTARIFIIFRCPYNDRVGEFIQLAKKLNKVVLYDIDDLVIDRKYTNQIRYLDSLSSVDRKGYDQGVDDMQKTMLLCDGVITSTEGMATELKNYLDTVFINRNVASEEMLYFSERAIEEQDVFPHLQKDSIARRNVKRWKNACSRFASKNNSIIHIGYFSGSITHNDDFELILPALARLFDQRPNVVLHIVGELDVPEQLARFKDRIFATPFMSWRRLPKLISEMDINIAPLEDSIFNRAKSENKWLEASLVKVPTIASNVGAFASEINNFENGILCSSVDDWFDSLVRLVDDGDLRKRLAENAYNECIQHRTTLTSGAAFARFIRSVFNDNIAFCVPSLDISGGNLVTLRHASIMRKHGYDVTIVDGYGEKKWVTAAGVTLPVVNRHVHPERIDDCPIDMTFDKCVGTFWETQLFVDRYRKAEKKYYLVQNLETGFYSPMDAKRSRVVSTYSYNDVNYLTVSKWCKGWLASNYGQKVRFAPNGIELSNFHYADRDYSGKIRILIEGDSAAAHKNVDESFRIVESLDKSKFEIWYLSCNGEPKDWYHVDRFFHAVPQSEISSIYEQCHILLKTSILESFSYPPLEMMATGGVCVVLSNFGNAEYLTDGENCLLFNEGEDVKAAELIHRLATDFDLRTKLAKNGLDTAQSRDWSTIESAVVSLYE